MCPAPPPPPPPVYRYTSNVVCHKSSNSLVLCFSPFPAPPLTLENVCKTLQHIKDWRRFGGHLLGYYSSENHLKAVVESFLLGKGHHQPSWRRVIHELHWTNQYQYVPDIKNYAEAVEGKCESIIVCTLLNFWST